MALGIYDERIGEFPVCAGSRQKAIRALRQLTELGSRLLPFLFYLPEPPKFGKALIAARTGLVFRRNS